MTSSRKTPGAPHPKPDRKLSFIAYLERRLATDPPAQKGQRTRERLKISTAKVLSERGYHALRVADVTEAAGVAEGSFYVYFRDKTDASVAVLTSYLEEFSSQFMPGSGQPSAYLAMQFSNRAWIRLCRANMGLVRCILQLGDEIPAFAELTARTNHDWYRRVASSVVHHYPAGAADERAVLLAVYLLGSMMDELTRKFLVYPQRQLLELLRALRLDDDGLADAATVLWMRCLYPAAPLPADISEAARLFANWPAGGTLVEDRATR